MFVILPIAPLLLCHKNIAELLEKLETNSELAIYRCEDNYIKLNTGKCHILISSHKYEHQYIWT